MSRRRLTSVLLGIAVLAAPLCSFAQQHGKVWRVGFLASIRRPDSVDSDEQYGAFARGMRDLGYIDGKNLVIEWRFVGGHYDLFPDFAAELVQLPVDIIVTDSTTATIAAQKATHTIPIVFGSAGDPIGNGLVNSLARPGGNTTGLSLVTSDTAPKQLELLLNIVPRLSRVAVLLRSP